MTDTRHTVLYISHGAGPLPILGDEAHTEMVANLKELASRIGKPSAIVVVSAHWEEPVPAVTGAARPELIYDYYGFPQESYEIEYPAPGEPKLAAALHGALTRSGVECRLDGQRGLDHGVFIPLKIMYPEADIPCVQLSLIQGLDPAAHVALGKGLVGVEHDNLLIIGSGFSFHNMRAFFAPDTPDTRQQNAAFQEWLVETCATDMSAKDREDRLLDWESAPHARYCHPREEHLLPLHVCCGATGRPADDHYGLTIFGKQATAFLWE
ncbi:DODA-type extradiol aromatic ring-opening family dioxygenase [Pseudodesulfovibrio portus]|uniref:Dioxygenase n=1 Tax=Pseudodesulfovibrio portus TaxID=231439 RepID=A0ABM8ATR3_9BACT|nr:class III extradiol ring-cleavage dioxygenase [Pseudodesulfovibrio portus]BDQ34826.1 dioxygenase [Pseudodesulfovibrio portus]